MFSFGQTLSFNIVGNTNPAILSVAPAIDSAGNLTYTPALGTEGTTTITVSLSDNGGTANGGVDTSATQTFDITVTSTSADLVLTVTNNAPQPVFSRDQFDYTLTLTNNGAGFATNSSVEILLSNNLIVIGTPACVTDMGGVLIWDAGDLAANNTVQCTFRVEVRSPGDITLTASASSDLADPNGSNNVNIIDALQGSALPVPSTSLWGLMTLIFLTLMISRRRLISH